MRFKPYLRFDELVCTVYIGYRWIVTIANVGNMIPFVFFIVSHTDRPSVHGASPFYIRACTVHCNCSRNLSKRFSIKYLAAVHIFCTFERDKYKCVFLITVSMGTLKILSCGYNLVTERKLESINCYDTRSWEKGSFSSLSANKGVNQRVTWFTPFIAPKIFDTMNINLITYRGMTYK